MSLRKNQKLVLDKFQSRLPSWKSKALSFGGRITLIKAVLGSLSIYCFHFLKLQKWLWKLKDNSSTLWAKIVIDIHHGVRN